MKAGEEFVAGRHGIAWVGDRFAEAFHSLSFTPRPTLQLIEMNLMRSMTDEEILAELKPAECTLGDLFTQIHSRAWPWCLLYIRDRDRVLRPVQLLVQDGEWYIDAAGGAEPWPAIYRVLGRRKPNILRRFLQSISLAESSLRSRATQGARLLLDPPARLPGWLCSPAPSYGVLTTAGKVISSTTGWRSGTGRMVGVGCRMPANLAATARRQEVVAKVERARRLRPSIPRPQLLFPFGGSGVAFPHPDGPAALSSGLPGSPIHLSYPVHGADARRAGARYERSSGR